MAEELPLHSFAQVLLDRVQATPRRPAFQLPSEQGWSVVNWAWVGARVCDMAAGFHALGVGKGQRIALLSETRVEWILADLAILTAGAANTTLYASGTDGDCAFILGDSEAVVAVVEDLQQLAKIDQHWDSLPELQHVVLIDGHADHDRVMTLAQLEELGRSWRAEQPGEVERRARAVGPEDLACLIYTSGTTGPPKGVMLVHDCFMSIAESFASQVDPLPDDKQYLFLPLAHVYGKVCELVAVYMGVVTAVDGRIDRLADGLLATRPSMVGGVPRVFEKIHARVFTQARAAGERRFAIFQRALAVGLQVVELEQAGRPVPMGLRLRYALADRLVFRKIRAAFGGRVRAWTSGGAPLSPDIGAFFFAVGMPVYEGYGLTETCGVSSVNREDSPKLGTVGPINPALELQIAADGEVLLRGRPVMRGYWRRPEASAQALDAEGWLHTGDIGALDPDGRLVITDRKKNLIVTSGGKNVAPQNIESAIKAACELVSQAVLLGDGRPYCVALLTLDDEAAQGWALRNGHQDLSLAQLSELPALRDEVWGRVQAVNAGLARYQTIKKVAVLPRDLSVEQQELTPSMKVRRDVVKRHFAQRIEQLYREDRPC